MRQNTDTVDCVKVELLQRKATGKWQDKPQNGRRYSQITNLTYLFLEYTFKTLKTEIKEKRNVDSCSMSIEFQFHRLKSSAASLHNVKILNTTA